MPYHHYHRASLNITLQMVMDMTNLDVSSPPPSNPNVRELPEDEDTSPTRGGPPSETSSQEWDKVTDPGAQTPATS
jgi:import receptor subunit TOM20